MSQEMYPQLFKDTSTALVEICVLDEILREANELISANGWEIDEGLRIIFTNGLNYLRGQQRVEGLDGNGQALAAEVKRLTREVMDMQSMYAVMKFRAFTVEQAKQALEFNVVGLEVENRWSGARLKKFREDEELLRANLRALKGERDELRQRLALLEAPLSDPPPPRRAGRARRRLAGVSEVAGGRESLLRVAEAATVLGRKRRQVTAKGPLDVTVEVVIDEAAASHNIYSYDQQREAFRLSGVKPQGGSSPFELGRALNTLGDDGSAIPALVLVDVPTFPGCRVKTRLIGGAELAEDGGSRHFLVGVPVVDAPVVDASREAVVDVTGLPSELRGAVERSLPGLVRWLTREEVAPLLREATESYWKAKAKGKRGAVWRSLEGDRTVPGGRGPGGSGTPHLGGVPDSQPTSALSALRGGAAVAR